MNPLIKSAALASVLALASLGAAQFAVAQGTGTPECPTPNCESPGMQKGPGQELPGRRIKKMPPPEIQDGQDQDQVTPSRRSRKIQPDNQGQGFGDNDNDDAVVTKKRVRRADRNWKFDSNRHERRRSKDKKFRFFFNGFWYPTPYWDDPYYDVQPYRVSCREGAEIVSERFSRVRIVDCDGRVYTYLGRRRGDTFEIKLNSRNGRIIDVRGI